MRDVYEVELVRLYFLLDIVGNCGGGTELKVMSRFEEEM